jgi:hypothetical protein
VNRNVITKQWIILIFFFMIKLFFTKVII